VGCFYIDEKEIIEYNLKEEKLIINININKGEGI
jgi:hypothetical protein